MTEKQGKIEDCGFIGNGVECADKKIAKLFRKYCRSQGLEVHYFKNDSGTYTVIGGPPA